MAARWRLMHVLYSAVLIAALPGLLIYLLYRRLRGKSREGWAERMGYLPAPQGKPAVWVHGVSVGEAVAAEAVVRALRARLPGTHILFTAGTPEGRATALKRMGDLLDCVAYVPYDFPWMVARAMDRVRPQVFVLVEAELWPNLLQAAADRGIPVMLANGYVSESTLRRGRWVPFLYRWIFSNIRLLCVQSEAVRDRALALGAPADRVRVMGSVKYDQACAPLAPEQAREWRSILQIRPDDSVFLAGSTHPGEEEVVLDAYRALRARGLSVRLILAPRHPKRADDIEALVRAAGLPVVRRTQLQGGSSPETAPDAVVLLDTMGELARLYSLADVVFLGGSLVPVGGHDILQPLIAGKPVLLGPHTFKQHETVQEALNEGVVWRVADGKELAVRAAELLEDRNSQPEREKRAKAFVSSRRGASRRYADVAARLLAESGARRQRERRLRAVGR